MFKLLNKKKNNKGFTLVELVIVVAILAILVGILAPQYTKYVEKSRKAADASNLENLVTVFKTAASDSTDKIAAGDYTITIDATKTEITVSPDAAAKTTLEGVFEEYAGNAWADTSLKSKKWTGNDGNTVTSISADINVGDDGAVTVEYDPTTVKTQAK